MKISSFSLKVAYLTTIFLFTFSISQAQLASDKDSKTSGIDVLTPYSRVIYSIGDTLHIKWDAINVDADYYYVLLENTALRNLGFVITGNIVGTSTANFIISKNLIDTISANSTLTLDQLKDRYYVRVIAVKNSIPNYTNVAHGVSGMFSIVFSTNMSSSTSNVSIPNPAVESSVTVISPNGGENWRSGSSENISFKKKPNNSNYRTDIYLVSENISGKTYVLHGGAGGTGVYDNSTKETIMLYGWTVGNINIRNGIAYTTVPAGSYRLRVCIVNTNICDISDKAFNIIAGSPSNSNSTNPNSSPSATVRPSPGSGTGSMITPKPTNTVLSTPKYTVPTYTPTPSPSSTYKATPVSTPAYVPTPSATYSPISTPTPTPSITPTPSPSSTYSPPATPTPTPTSTFTPTPTLVISPSSSPNPSSSPSAIIINENIYASVWSAIVSALLKR